MSKSCPRGGVPRRTIPACDGKFAQVEDQERAHRPDDHLQFRHQGVVEVVGIGFGTTRRCVICAAGGKILIRPTTELSRGQNHVPEHH